MNVCKVIYKVNWKSCPPHPEGKQASSKALNAAVKIFVQKACCSCHQMDKTTSWKDLVIMGLAFAMMTDTELGEWVIRIDISYGGVSARLSPRQAFPEKAADWKEARTQRRSSRALIAEMILKNKSNYWSWRFVLCSGCVISAFPSRGNRRVRSSPSGAVQQWSCKVL